MIENDYRITLRGAVGPSVRSRFEDVDITVDDDRTVLSARALDQAGFHSLLRRIQDLGLEVMDVHRTES